MNFNPISNRVWCIEQKKWVIRKIDSAYTSKAWANLRTICKDSCNVIAMWQILESNIPMYIRIRFTEVISFMTNHKYLSINSQNNFCTILQMKLKKAKVKHYTLKIQTLWFSNHLKFQQTLCSPKLFTCKT